MEEKWAKIKYEDKETNYSISTLGRVRNDKRNNFLKPCLVSGYYTVSLAIAPQKTKKYRINRLVAEYFIPNPENKEYVNHIDGDKLNNVLDNLEWVTPSENSKHAFEAGLREKSRVKPVNQYNLQGKFMMTYLCINDASRDTEIPQSKISEVCIGNRKTAGGFQWRYNTGDYSDISPIQQRKNLPKRVAQYDLNWNLIAIYDSYTSAAKAVNGSRSAITNICAGVPGHHTHKNFFWKIVDDIVQMEIE